jgi:polyhydroxyalkanoate synthesis regulator phasin
LVGVTHSTQKTLGDQPDNQIRRIQLTDKGESFVERHRADLSMPVDVAELAKRVSQLQIEDGLVDELRAKVNDLEQRIEDLEAQ